MLSLTNTYSALINQSGFRGISSWLELWCAMKQVNKALREKFLHSNWTFDSTEAGIHLVTEPEKDAANSSNSFKFHNSVNMLGYSIKKRKEEEKKYTDLMIVSKRFISNWTRPINKCLLYINRRRSEKLGRVTDHQVHLSCGRSLRLQNIKVFYA